ncbi:hypothetical protein Sjap_010407 [Stephania japonica]|uniref:Uncharacterized protein n=1 Tax=Stephania japonica TaxID=461633 RepID=A0AAP0JAC3_9MAGN
MIDHGRRSCSKPNRWTAFEKRRTTRYLVRKWHCFDSSVSMTCSVFWFSSCSVSSSLLLGLWRQCANWSLYSTGSGRALRRRRRRLRRLRCRRRGGIGGEGEDSGGREVEVDDGIGVEGVGDSGRFEGSLDLQDWKDNGKSRDHRSLNSLPILEH